MSVRVLNSWKEIATYMNRGVRTVQRWERDLKLPVRRPRGKRRSAVIAIADDLDHWLQHTPLPEEDRKPQSANLAELVASRERLHKSTQKLITKTGELRTNLQHAYDLCESMTQRRQNWQNARDSKRLSA